MPKILIEAAACGLPIITTNHPGCRDSIIPNKTGLLIPINDNKSLTIAIKKLFKDQILYENMSKEARNYAIKLFNIQDVVRKHMELYDELTN